MNQRINSIMIGGVTITAIGAIAVIVGINGHHRPLEVIGWLAEVIGVFFLGVALGMRNGGGRND